MHCQEEALASRSRSITARSGHSPLPGQRRPQHCRDNSLPVQDNPIQRNHLLNNWREASPHTADPNLNVPTSWGKSSGSGNVLKKRLITWEVRRTLNFSPKAVAKLLFIQEMHLGFTKNIVCMWGRPSSQATAKGSPWSPAQCGTWALCSHPCTARVKAMCASLSGYHNTREASLLHHQSQNELSTAFYPILSLPPICAGIWAKGSQKGPQLRLTLEISPNTPINEEPFGWLFGYLKGKFHVMTNGQFSPFIKCS